MRYLIKRKWSFGNFCLLWRCWGSHDIHNIALKPHFLLKAYYFKTEF